FFFHHDSTSPHPTTLSLHDALPISRIDAQSKLGFFSPGFVSHSQGNQNHDRRRYQAHDPGDRQEASRPSDGGYPAFLSTGTVQRDRKSTRLNSSHGSISYAVFCLKK